MELVKNIEEAKFITHSGTMHADEIFSTAFFDLLYGNIKVYRTPSIPTELDKDVLVYDIGRKEFDHHQEDAAIREKWNQILFIWINLEALWKRISKKEKC